MCKSLKPARVPICDCALSLAPKMTSSSSPRFAERSNIHTHTHTHTHTTHTQRQSAFQEQGKQEGKFVQSTNVGAQVATHVVGRKSQLLLIFWAVIVSGER